MKGFTFFKSKSDPVQVFQVVMNKKATSK